ncbi:MAG: glutamine amidotransferase [Pseudomonadota bacterium]|nr:glutamine amidotransferase [Pseudomonadota bacterium]
MLDRPRPPAPDPRACLWGRDPLCCDGEAKKPVLLIVHQEHSCPGHVANWFAANGYPIDLRRPRYGDPLPDTLEHHVGAVIFGGPQSANDPDDYIRRETDWIAVPLSEAKPFLGICLGAQMLARHLGARVGFDADGFAEMGYYPLRPTEEGRKMCAWPSRVYQWHREGFELPSGASLLAQGERFPQQAFRYGPAAFAVQFHPEITQRLIFRWTTRAGHRLVLPGAGARDTHFAGHLEHGPDQRRWLDGFLSAWVGLGSNAGTDARA